MCQLDLCSRESNTMEYEMGLIVATSISAIFSISMCPLSGWMRSECTATAREGEADGGGKAIR